MKEETKTFIEIAEENLKTAKKDYEIEVYRSACFWAQQAIEMFLKAFLVERDAFNPKIHKTHNLLFLIEECEKFEDFSEIKD